MADTFSFTIRPVNKQLLMDHLNEMIAMAHRNISDEYWASEHFLHELKDKWRLSFLVFEKNNLIGFLIASRKENSVHIHKFIVDEKMQRNGVGGLMLEHLLHSVDDTVTLKVSIGNVKALSFYEKHGFREIARQKDLITLQLKR